MAHSLRLRDLLARLKTLEAHFLPKDLKFSPTGQYTRKEEDLGRAYVLLVHAELESYFEDRVEEVIFRAHTHWRNTTKATKTLERLLRCHLYSQSKYWMPINPSEDAVNRAINSHRSTVRSNNGVKEANLLSMLFPIGLDYDRFDTGWLATMDSFGSLRGGFAHTSQMSMQQAIDLQGQYITVKTQIIPELKVLDRKISRLG